MRVLLISIGLVFYSFSALAQQWVEFSQQNQYKLFINPAKTGNKSELYASLAHRSQYTFLTKRAIASQFAEFSMPVLKKNYGVGLRLVNDFIGYQRYTLIEATGAYHLFIKNSKLSFGFGVGVVNLSINGSKLRASGGDYENEAVIHNDEKIPSINVGGTSPSFSFGLLYSIAKFEFGLAIQNINSPKISLSKNNSETKVNINRTINLHSSYVINMINVNIIPMINYNTDFIKHQMQVGINTELNNIYFGLAFRGYSGKNNDAVIGKFGVNIKKQIRIGYSYDYSVSNLNKSSFGSHEISISYKLKQKFSTKNKGNVLFNPRFL